MTKKNGFAAAAARAKDAAKKNGKFLRWERKTIEGNEIAGKYEPIQGKITKIMEEKELDWQGKKRTVTPIVLEVTVGEDKIEKEFSVSDALGRTLNEVGAGEGSSVIMYRSGETKDTKYKVEVV